MNQVIKPMSYFEAKSFAKKYKLVMKAIENDGDKKGLYFQMEENYIYFFTKTTSGELEPIEDDVNDYLPQYWEYYYKPVGKAK